MSIVTAKGTILPIVGVSFYQDAIKAIEVGDPVLLYHDVDNEYDSNAVAAKSVGGELLGFLPRNLASRVSDPTMGGVADCRYEAIVCDKTSFEQDDGTIGHGLRVKIAG